jgi:hypothetical protein
MENSYVNAIIINSIIPTLCTRLAANTHTFRHVLMDNDKFNFMMIINVALYVYAKAPCVINLHQVLACMHSNVCVDC